MLKENMCADCFAPLRDCVCEYPAVEIVLNEMQKNTPEGWKVTHEYPDNIGVCCDSFTSDSHFIMLGDTNGFYLFNDEMGEVVGDMEKITNPAEIVASFWEQLKKFYPDLLKGAN